MFYIIDMKDEVVNEFVKFLLSVKWDLYFCSICGNIIEEDFCEICRNFLCDCSIILVVEELKDVMVMEKMWEYYGFYYVFYGVLLLMEGIGLEDINIFLLL